MDLGFLDRKEYQGIRLIRMEEGARGLPYFVIRMDRCNRETHRHAFVQIEYVRKGRLRHAIGERVFDVRKGDIFLIPPFVPHRFLEPAGEPFELVEFEFVPEFVNERFAADGGDTGFLDFAYLEPFLVEEDRIRPRFRLGGAAQLAVEGILDEVLAEDRARRDGFLLVVKALLLKLLVLVKREGAAAEGGSRWPAALHVQALGRTVRYIEENSGSAIGVEDAARMAMVSPAYFRTLFRRVTGKGFTEYLRSLRVARAVELLASCPEKKVIDVCHEVGYGNVNHFNRIFRRETGLTPGEVRRGARGAPADAPDRRIR